MSSSSFYTPGGYEYQTPGNCDVDMNTGSANLQNQQPQDLFEASNHGSSRDEQMKQGGENCG
jgi:hypothetical protein